MAKESKITVEGGIVRSVNHDICQVELPNGATIQARVSGKMRMNAIRVLPGDKVVVELSSYDITRGLIKYRK